MLISDFVNNCQNAHLVKNCFCTTRCPHKKKRNMELVRQSSSFVSAGVMYFSFGKISPNTFSLSLCSELCLQRLAGTHRIQC